MLERIEVEQENVRSALAWALDAGQAERALRLATALRFFWETRGHFAEAGRWLNEALAQEADVDPAVRAKALTTAGTIAFRTGDVETARERYEQGLVIWRELGDEQGIARCLSDIGTVAAAVGESRPGGGDARGERRSGFGGSISRTGSPWSSRTSGTWRASGRTTTAPSS